MIPWIDYHITDVCNLNCAHCSHFTPLIPKGTKPKSIQQITADLTLLSRFEIRTLTLMGGEPTMHPQLGDIIILARKLFPNTELIITTNGTLPNKLINLKDIIIANNIIVWVSIYPIDKEDPFKYYNILSETFPSENLRMSDEPTIRGMNFTQLAERDDAASISDILKCKRRWSCTQLKNGRIYLCHFAAQFNVLKDAFKDDINWDLDGREYIDLNGDPTEEDIINFLGQAVPEICKHCTDAHNGNWDADTVPWAKTEYKLSEWYQK